MNAPVTLTLSEQAELRRLQQEFNRQRLALADLEILRSRLLEDCKRSGDQLRQRAAEIATHHGLDLSKVWSLDFSEMTFQSV